MLFIVGLGRLEAMTMQTKKLWKRGRKPKPKTEKQSVRVVAYLKPSEVKNLRYDALGLNMTPSAFLAGLWRDWRVSREN